MKNIFIAIGIITALTLLSCRTTKHLNKAISAKDKISQEKQSIEDSIKSLTETFTQFKSHHIDFKTFSAKIKVESSDSKGKNPDITGVVRIIKDSAIWMSLTATFLNIEVYRVLITKNNIILINKQDKEVKYRSLDYLQEVTQIPFDYNTLQDLIIGNPIFYSDSVNSYRKKEEYILLSTVDPFFKNLFTLSNDNKIMLHSKMDDVDVARSRTADITYSDYENKNGIFFSTSRQILASEKNKIDIRLTYKQYEFNKELSVALTIPKNYKRK